MPAEATVGSKVIDPEEVAYDRHRRLARRRQFAAILVAASLAISFLGWKVAMHLTATLWLEANHYVVTWGIEKDDWKQGGSSSVRYSGKGWYLFSNEKPTPDLKYLVNLHRLEELDLSGLAETRDADLANLDRLTALRRLNIDRSRLSDYGRNVPGALTDATLARIGRLHRLIELNLGCQGITDAGLDQVEKLDLVDTGITDAGLEHLKGLKGLKSLDLSGTKVTPAGVAAFEAARPFVKVIADQAAAPPIMKPKR